MREAAVPSPLESTLKDVDKAFDRPDRATVLGENGGENVWEERGSTQSPPMPVSRTLKKKLPIYF